MKSHDIKDILEERTIEVSENSWEKLASQLDMNDQNKKRKGFYPYAACLALLFSFIIFMIAKKDISQETSIVNSEETIKLDTESITPSPIILKEEISDELFKEALVASEESMLPQQTKTIVKAQKEEASISNQQKEKLEVELKKEVQNAVAVNEKIIVPKVIETISAQKEVIIDPNKDLRASIAALSATENVAITDEEINELLKEAQQSFDKLDVKETVDLTAFATADELLNEVEYELDMSFKRKVFELIKRNVQKTRTVVVDP